jgi:hypothetical protein
MNEDHQQRRLNALPSAKSPQERGSAAWFDGQYCSLEAFIGSLIYKPQYCAERLTCPISVPPRH